MHAGGGGPSHSAVCFVLHGGHAAGSLLFPAYATSGLIAVLKQITQCAVESALSVRKACASAHPAYYARSHSVAQ